MATPSLSSLTQGVGFPGYCVLSWSDPTGLGNVSVSFLPTLVRMVQPQFTPLQKVNIAIGGQIHVFQYSSNEPLAWPLDITDLPYDTQASQRLPQRTAGFMDLLSFIRTTVNYSEKVFTVLVPDGQIETVRYLKGLEQFREAAGQTNRAQFWTGQLLVTRIIT